MRRMQVDMLEATPRPEEVVCRGARNDYMSEYGADLPFDEVMKTVDAANNRAWAVKHLKKDGADWDFNIDLVAKQRTLITHLMKHGHFGPFEHAQATFQIKGISRSCMAQITRHRHASFDVQSMRYVKFDNAEVVDIPELDDPGLCGRNADFHDKYDDYTDEEILALRRAEYQTHMDNAFRTYQNLLDLGAAPENARMVLPIGTKVNMVVSINARMLMHIVDMRAAADAQWEVREMTEQILEHAKEWMPITFDVYEKELKGRKNRLAP